MKTCKQCNIEKDLNNFYVHKEMLDGYLNKCKECVKKRIAKHRELNIDYINDYDKKRAMLPHRVKARKEYLKTENGKEAKAKAIKNYKNKFPMVYAAHIIFSNAIRDKRVKQEFFCSKCGSDNQIQGHHDDYTKPLDVRWLCVKCHSKWHKNNEPIYF